MKPTRRIKLASMPLDLGDHAAERLPALRLIAKAVVVSSNLNGRTADGAIEQVVDALLQNTVGRYPKHV
jgi:hypothetical protein